jgi:hypothetical protein
MILYFCKTFEFATDVFSQNMSTTGASQFEEHPGYKMIFLNVIRNYSYIVGLVLKILSRSFYSFKWYSTF